MDLLHTPAELLLNGRHILAMYSQELNENFPGLGEIVQKLRLFYFMNDLHILTKTTLTILNEHTRMSRFWSSGWLDLGEKTAVRFQTYQEKLVRNGFVLSSMPTESISNN
jgi:hypothetical protein